MIIITDDHSRALTFGSGLVASMQIVNIAASDVGARIAVKNGKRK
jgi:hypothetical protein